MNTAIAYSRVSPPDQQGKSGLVLEAQREEYANLKQLLADPVLTGIGRNG